MDLTGRESHFEFGRNWQEYASTIDAARIQRATEGLRKLFPGGLSGSFLDIGCGSGLHSLAALGLGASQVIAADFDENSVATARAVLSGKPAEVREQSVFDMSPAQMGQFDTVYSWGVLHHTGDMWRAIETAAKLVKPGGQFAIAIYTATALDPLWKIEKRIYSKAPKAAQWIAQKAFVAALIASKMVRLRNPMSTVNQLRARGMNFDTGIHDWLGGYPYETATAEELHNRICALGFAEDRSFRIPPSLGLFGSGCHEFVFRRQVAG